MAKRILLFAIPIIIVFLVYLYNYLGGFNDVSIALMPADTVILIGKEYSGRYRSTEVEELFYSVKDEISKSNNNGYLTIVNYPTENESDVRYFIGSTREGLNPEKWDRLELSGYSQFVRLKFNKHNLVMPKPFKVLELAREYAENEGLQLEGTSIEKYKSEREVEIDFLVR